jgi:hypothetical protein
MLVSDQASLMAVVSDDGRCLKVYSSMQPDPVALICAQSIMSRR